MKRREGQVAKKGMRAELRERKQGRNGVTARGQNCGKEDGRECGRNRGKTIEKEIGAESVREGVGAKLWRGNEGYWARKRGPECEEDERAREQVQDF